MTNIASTITTAIGGSTCNFSSSLASSPPREVTDREEDDPSDDFDLFVSPPPTITSSSSSSSTTAPTSKEKRRYQYRDLSRVFSLNSIANEDARATQGQTMQRLPTKLNAILSNPDIQHIISWLPHGRSWKVHDSQKFMEEVMPHYFEYTNYYSFIRLVNAWGFRRMSRGPSKDSYWHEMFLRGLPNLHARMRRLTLKDKKEALSPDEEPDLFEESRLHPLPRASVIPFPPRPPKRMWLEEQERLQKLQKKDYDVVVSSQQQQQPLRIPSPPILSREGTNSNCHFVPYAPQPPPQRLSPPPPPHLEAMPILRPQRHNRQHPDDPRRHNNHHGPQSTLLARPIPIEPSPPPPGSNSNDFNRVGQRHHHSYQDSSFPLHRQQQHAHQQQHQGERVQDTFSPPLPPLAMPPPPPSSMTSEADVLRFQQAGLAATRRAMEAQLEELRQQEEHLAMAAAAAAAAPSSNIRGNSNNHGNASGSIGPPQQLHQQQQQRFNNDNYAQRPQQHPQQDDPTNNFFMDNGGGSGGVHRHGRPWVGPSLRPPPLSPLSPLSPLRARFNTSSSNGNGCNNHFNTTGSNDMSSPQRINWNAVANTTSTTSSNPSSKSLLCLSPPRAGGGGGGCMSRNTTPIPRPVMTPIPTTHSKSRRNGMQQPPPQYHYDHRLHCSSNDLGQS